MSLESIETGTFSTEASRTTSSGRFRIVSWNINRGSCLEQIIEFLAATEADLVLLQECDLNAARSGFRNVASEIAQRLNMNYVFGAEFIELSQGASALHGQATLARTQLSNPRVLRFKHQSNFWKPRWFLPNHPRLQRRLGGRMALVTEACIHGRTVTVYNLHLESRGGDDLRCAQLLEIAYDARGCSPKSLVLIAGDFNCDLSLPPFSYFICEQQFRNPFVGAAYKPTIVQRRQRRSCVLDCILHGRADIAQLATVHNSAVGSDHFPLSLNVELA